MFRTFIYNPLYNGLILVLDILPGIDVGVAVILFTIIIKILLLPLSRKAIRTQAVMKVLQPKLEEIKKRYKDNKQLQAQKTLELYKDEKVNPFSSIFLILIQIPIIFALYFVFLKGGLPEINTDILYSFIDIPENIRMTFLGLVDISAKSLPLALLTGITQFIQVKYSMPKSQSKKDGSFGSNFAHSMQLQMRYGMPVIIAMVAWSLPAMISLYWITSNVFTIGQEILVRREQKPNK